MFKIAVLVSGNGTDLQSIIDAIDKKYLHVQIAMVISDKADAYALERAQRRGIKTYTVSKKEAPDDFSDRILALVAGRADLLVLAGFLSILSGSILTKFKQRIINIHPALLPSFGGAGMYGLKVHEKVIASGVKISGCTVHFVDATVDGGAIIAQAAVPVYCSDTPQQLQARVLEQEHLLLGKAIKLISEGKVKVVGRVVAIIGEKGEIL